jgi:hypothetical protein
MEAAYSFEMSVRIYHIVRYHIPKHRTVDTQSKTFKFREITFVNVITVYRHKNNEVGTAES